MASEKKILGAVRFRGETYAAGQEEAFERAVKAADEDEDEDADRADLKLLTKQGAITGFVGEGAEEPSIYGGGGDANSPRKGPEKAASPTAEEVEAERIHQVERVVKSARARSKRASKAKR